ncbi:tonB-system energizer ExbB [Granulibacter bethesdensis]|uniref:Biopolymer transport protein ExbB n=1 Tax=Granulibacter bethesdensis (strain ATCC BAA-1260 / CGDNIH1) TaxID=391165 RepID=Q0BW65_GRABC|nr:tonB-system energizer ExbB [Granulibacter bethesdensis]ABI60937.1 TolQ protein [Granulibacter bethesdensis CGDNIH1]APH50702.1 TolQ protein [Granulibacter bethesdensis]APH63397.1 TolQ protein [Granulibacter bethesdensis]
MSIRSNRLASVHGALTAVFLTATSFSLGAGIFWPGIVSAQTASSQTAPAPASAPAAPAPVGTSAGSFAPTPDAASTAAPKITEAAVDADLPHDLSVQAMFHNADLVVKAVMLGLVAASILTWTILLAKGIEIAGARRSLRRDLSEAMAERSLATLQARQHGRGMSPGVAMVNAAAEEIIASGDRTGGIQERVVSRLRRLEAAYGRRIGRGTGFLATIGATSPFIGLFGTVWGIMNSFIGISQSHTTNLAVVAPGIAEALLATATGLVAAIPAVVIYNSFARITGGYRAQLTDLTAAVTRIVSRDLDGQRSLRHAAE